MIEPPQISMSELGGEMRESVEKMLWDQAAKHSGGPTSEDRLREANIRRLKAMHPGVDFSGWDFRYAFNNYHTNTLTVKQNSHFNKYYLKLK